MVKSNDDYTFRTSVESSGSRTIIDMLPDGNCLFRSISDQLYRDYGRHHDEVRRNICQFITENSEEFKAFLVYDDSDDADVTDVADYMDKMSEDGEWGGNPELVAAARFYERNITIFSVDGAYSIECGQSTTSGCNVNLSYHGNDHYNSVRDESSTTFEVYRSIPTKKKNSLRTNNDESISTTDEHDEVKKGQNHMGQRRNDMCACGSGFRYKRCCMKIDKKRALRKEKLDDDNMDSNAARLSNGGGSSCNSNDLDDEFKILHI